MSNYFLLVPKNKRARRRRAMLMETINLSPTNFVTFPLGKWKLPKRTLRSIAVLTGVDARAGNTGNKTLQQSKEMHSRGDQFTS